jgi:hypothetical protein
MVFSKNVLELGIWSVLSSYQFLTVQTASSHLDYSYCLITEPTTSLKMISMMIETSCSVFKYFNTDILD